MKKITFSITASVIYTIIGILVTLSNMADKAKLTGKIYTQEWGFIDQIVDGIEMMFYDLMIDIFGVPSLIAGLIAGTLSIIALCIYNKNYEETTACTVLSIISIFILASITSLYILGFAGLFLLSA